VNYEELPIFNKVEFIEKYTMVYILKSTFHRAFENKYDIPK